MALRQVLVIGGSDSGAGAGVQADLKSVHASGGYALTALTAVTAQNTVATTRTFDLPAEIVRAQIEALVADFDVAAVKTGMLASTAIVETVAEALAGHHLPNVVVDPVMIAETGRPLLQEEAIAALQAKLIPLAAVVTPNRFEAEKLAGRTIASRDDVLAAGRHLLALGCRAVVVKGGHLPAAPATDFLIAAGGVTAFPGERVQSGTTHGTGCTFAAALATQLARGRDLAAAVRAAKELTAGAIRHGHRLGHGSGPIDPLWRLRPGGPPSP